jgi:hypothetical protein
VGHLHHLRVHLVGAGGRLALNHRVDLVQLGLGRLDGRQKFSLDALENRVLLLEALKGEVCVGPARHVLVNLVEVLRVSEKLLVVAGARSAIGEDVALRLVVDILGRIDEHLSAVEVATEGVTVAELGNALEEVALGLGQAVDGSANVLLVDQRVGADVVDAGASDALVEMNFGVREHELVAVAGLEMVDERAHPEGSLLAVDATEALVEEATDGARANPVGLVGIEATVGRHAPLVRVLVVVDADEGSLDELLDVDGAVAGTHADVGLGVSTTDDRVVALVENGTLVLQENHVELLVERLELLDVVGNEHVEVLILDDADVLGGEVVLDSLEVGREIAVDVGGDGLHCSGWLVVLGQIY